ncbi:MAG: hypothetical protein WC596_01800 [Candidatus Shapirobacteria bacterium]
MAAPITHIVLTYKVFDRLFNVKDKAAFFVGTSFPDIRYLGITDRDKTHSHENNLAEVIVQSSFTTGVKFHSLVDRIRENFYRKHNIYPLIPDSVYATQAIKIYEDILFYDRIKDWKTISGYFDQIHPEELSYNLKAEDVQRWHLLLKQYIQKQPDTDNIRNFIDGISGGRKTMYDEIERVIEEIKNNQILENKINEMYINFDDLLTE